MSQRQQRKPIPLDLFLGAQASYSDSSGPVVVVDMGKRRRSFMGRRVSDRSLSNSTSFCSSVTSASMDSFSLAELCSSRWESIPCSNKAKKAPKQDCLRPPNRLSSGLKKPSRSLTNDMNRIIRPGKNRSMQRSAKLVPPARKSFRIPRRHDSKGSRKLVSASTSTIPGKRGSSFCMPKRVPSIMEATRSRSLVLPRNRG